MKKTFLIMIICLFSLLIFVSASHTQSITGFSITSLYYNDSFSYSNLYSNHGWAFSNGGCGFDTWNSPILSPFSTNAFGYNFTNPCGFGYSRYIGRYLYENHTTGNILIVYNNSVINKTSSGGWTNAVSLRNYSACGSGCTFTVYHNNLYTNQTMVDNTYPGGESCNFSFKRSF